MSENESFKIDILKDYKEHFQTHLKLEKNHRILFSGIFGSGKTTFLKDFFSEIDIKQKYEIIHLFPVNYPVATNEDIFELIKFDIFLQLLAKTTDFEKVKIDLDITGYQFIINNFKEILFPFLNFIPSVGGNIYKTIEKLLSLQDKFTEYHQEHQTDAKKEVVDFINGFNKIKGTIYETDFYTELIISIVESLKKDNKNVILILDDLDRIDPEHIFRLLNIFAAHVDIEGKGNHDNKFGFDKVIFVGDINNIRNIYSHKYGISTDFNGYIDKFCSNQVFNFEIAKIVEAYLDIILRKVRSKNKKFIAYHLSEDSVHLRTHLTNILSTMLINGSMSLRRLIINCVENEFYPREYSITKNILNYQDYTSQLYDFLLYFFGGHFDDLIYSIKRCKKINDYVNTEDTNISCFLSIIEIEKHKFVTGSYQYLPKGLHNYISYQIIRTRADKNFFFFEVLFDSKVKMGNQIMNEEQLKQFMNHFELMEEAFLKLNQLKNSPLI